MSKISVIEPTRPFRWIDSGVYRQQPIEPIIRDEALANSMSIPESLPVIHLWVCTKALYLGRRDAKLPQLENALRAMAQRGYGAILRSSGGACVPLDEGVLNIAILLPNQQLSIDAFFQFASSLLREGLHPYGDVEFGEVAGSYCVGDYDFAINKKKIGGMAQRRTRYGSILQLCVNVEGSGLSRGMLMEEFYREAGLEQLPDQQKPIPAIDGHTIGSLEEVAFRSVIMEEVKQNLFAAISSSWETIPTPLSLSKEDITTARAHLLERLSLFSFTPDEILEQNWSLQFFL